MYATLKKYWVLVLVIVLAGCAITGIGTQFSSTRQHLSTARERIAELESSLARAGARTDELEQELNELRDTYNGLELEYSLLKDKYSDIRRNYTAIELGNSDLQRSNEESLRLVREGRQILSEIEASE